MSSDLSLFNFNAEHNGVQCIASLKPEDAHTNNAFWFTISMFVEIFGEIDSTIRRNIDSLGKDEEVDLQKCKTRIDTRDSNGIPHAVSLYNLEVLNKLGMCCFRGNQKAKDIRNKFNDVLVEKETGLPRNYLEALKALVVSEEAKEAAQKALAAEKEQHEADNRDFCNGLDILNRKKAEISTRREATCMNKVAQVNRENRRLNDENGNLKDQVGRGQNWKTISEMRKEWFGAFGHEPSWKMLKSISAEIGIAPIKDVLEFMTDRFGRSQERKVNRYHNEVWKRYEAYERSIQG